MKFRNILISFPIILILILTLLLLEFIGYGEAKRKYTQFQLDRLATQGEIIKNGFDAYLQAGLPLKQFSGFASQSQTLLLSDDSIQAIQIVDNKDNIVFLNGQGKLDDLKETLMARHYSLSQFKLGRNAQVLESLESFRVILPLNTRFGLVGQVIVESEREDLLQILNEKFQFVFYVMLTLVIIFVFSIMIYETYFSNKRTRERFLKTVYIVEFITMSIVISVVIFQIYQSGAQASTKALSNSMSQRLSAILELGIQIEDISRINQTFKDYKQNNPYINQIALTKNNIVIFHTDERAIGQPYHVAPYSFEHVVPLSGGQEDQIFHVSVSIPIKVVMNAIWSSAKAFIVLFIACGLISFIFLDAGTALLTVQERREQALIKKNPEQNLVMDFSPSSGDEDTRFQIGLRLVKPAYFLIVFVNALSVSFLPQLAASMAEKTAFGWATASLPFSIFYTWFALVLIPAGYYAEKGDLKKLMAFGFISELIGLVLIASTDDFLMLTLSRMFSGMGQGAFLIGLQSYILVVTPKGRQTEGGAVKVTGRNAGMIAGTSIGALLSVYLLYNHIFMIASMITLLASIYLWALVPNIHEITYSGDPKKLKEEKKAKTVLSWQKVSQGFLVFKDFEFVNTLILIGLTSKIAIAGVVMFAVPLILSKKEFASEDIGLGLMLFYISSMIITQYISRWVDYLGQTRWVLSASSWVGGLAILLLGLLGATTWTGQDFPGIQWLNAFALYFNQTLETSGLFHFESYLIFSFLILAGISNGLSTAPLLTHINKTAVAEKQGHKAVSAIYTFLERGGHILGPMVIGALLTLGHHNTLGLALFGIAMIISGFLFQLSSHKK